MAEDIVKDIGFLEIVELFGGADEAPRHETPLGKMAKEHIIGYQPWHRHDLPAGQVEQPRRQFSKIGNARPGHLEHIDTGEKFRCRPLLQHRNLAGEKSIPNGVFAVCIIDPALVDRPVRGARWRGAGRRCVGILDHGALPAGEARRVLINPSPARVSRCGRRACRRSPHLSR